MSKIAACPACNSASFNIVVEADSYARERFLNLSTVKYGGLMNSWLSDIGISIARCAVCNHHFYRNQPSPEQLHMMYEAARPLKKALNQSKPAPPIFAQRHLKPLLDLTRNRGIIKPTLLDYGSGMGSWPRAAADMGFRITAFEPSLNRSRGDQSNFEIANDLHHLEGKKFDVINLEQVLEHLANPSEIMLSIRQYCKPETVLRVTVPNMTRALSDSKLWHEWPFDGQCPHIMSPFEHLHGFTIQSLGMLLRRTGYQWLAGWPVWSTYTAYHLRRTLGRVFPFLGHTMALVQPSNHLDEI